MSYQEIAISRLRGNVHCIKDKRCGNGVYCKNTETNSEICKMKIMVNIKTIIAKTMLKL